ncbi:hypothetical protein ABND33_03975 [Paenibacillus larvae]
MFGKTHTGNKFIEMALSSQTPGLKDYSVLIIVTCCYTSVNLQRDKQKSMLRREKEEQGGENFE